MRKTNRFPPETEPEDEEKVHTLYSAMNAKLERDFWKMCIGGQISIAFVLVVVIFLLAGFTYAGVVFLQVLYDLFFN